MKKFIFLKAFLGLAAFIAIAVLALTFIAQKTRAPSIVLTNTDCPTACFYGIQPGKTTPMEALNILSQIEGVNSPSLIETKFREETTLIRWRFMRPVPDTAGYVHFAGGKVSFISIVTVNTLALSDVFQRWGQPEKLWTERGETDVAVDLFYPSKGYLVEASIDLPGDPSATTVEVTEKTPVFSVAYFDPAQFETVLANTAFVDPSGQLIPASLSPWPGLGPVKFK